ncbi:MAG: IS200/IS605 family transposase [Candidatus Paceibacterota bacterium]
MKYYRQAHVVYHNEYHIVWIPRFRRKILVPGVAEYLKKKIMEVGKVYPDLVCLEQNIQPDHVHLLMQIPPRMSVSRAVNILKSNTSSALKKQFKFLKNVYLDEAGIWSVGYFVSTVGVNEAVIRRYIQMQEKEDTGQAKLAI